MFWPASELRECAELNGTKEDWRAAIDWSEARPLIQVEAQAAYPGFIGLLNRHELDAALERHANRAPGWETW
jgi:hypothetical protein